MTLAHASAVGSTSHADAELPLVIPPQSRAKTALITALQAKITPAAFRVYTAILLTLPPGRELALAEIADAAAISPDECKMRVGELVRVGLIAKRRRVVRNDSGIPTQANRYLPVPVR